MNTRILAGAFVLCAAISGRGAHAALTVEPLGGAVTAQTLAQSLIGADSGIGSISNVQFVGNSLQAGSFSGGASAGLSFDSGILLSSGSVNDLQVTPHATGANSDMGGAGDARLTTLTGHATGDTAVLKFDFVPTASTIHLSYVFASTEYNLWVDYTFNDTFAAFVNGVNAALLPGTATAVQINSINCGQAWNTAPGSGPHCSEFVDNRTELGYVGSNVAINLGGFTTALSLDAAVNAGVTNSMYLVIGDDGDYTRDSVVFLAPGAAAVPEPSALHFLAAAAAILAASARRRMSCR